MQTACTYVHAHFLMSLCCVYVHVHFVCVCVCVCTYIVCPTLYPFIVFPPRPFLFILFIVVCFHIHRSLFPSPPLFLPLPLPPPPCSPPPPLPPFLLTSFSFFSQPNFSLAFGLFNILFALNTVHMSRHTLTYVYTRQVHVGKCMVVQYHRTGNVCRYEITAILMSNLENIIYRNYSYFSAATKLVSYWASTNALPVQKLVALTMSVMHCSHMTGKMLNLETIHSYVITWQCVVNCTISLYSPWMV